MGGLGFGYWLKDELRKRNMKQADLARIMHRDPGYISKVISANKGVGYKMAREFAIALELPIDVVYKASGLVTDEDKTTDEIIEEVLVQLGYMTIKEKKDVLEYAKFRKRFDESNARSGNKDQETISSES